MKFVSFRRDTNSYGILSGKGIVDVGKQLGHEYPDLGAVLKAGAMDRVAEYGGQDADYAADEVQLLPVITHPDKILCVGQNYLAHIKEMGRELPEYPTMFTRCTDSITGHRGALIRPRVSDKFDFEGELAVILGRQARYVKADKALDYIAGYSCFNDGSLRDFQTHTSQFTPGKNFHQSGSFGPALVTPDEVGELATLTLETRLNGEIMQHSSIGDLYFDVPYLIEYCSTFALLEPGDVIVTGTPGGVGVARKPPVWMKAGDTIEIEIDKVGTLTNPIIDEAVATD